MSDSKFRGWTVFLLAVIATCQLYIAVSGHLLQPTVASVRSSPNWLKQFLLSRRPLTEVSGEVEVSNTVGVEVNNTVGVEIENEPIEVRSNR